jgi:hypothetical protein
VQRVGHPARVGIWDLTDGRQVLRLRSEAAGEFVPMGERVIRDPGIVAAQARQVNGCALALAVRGALGHSDR